MTQMNADGVRVSESHLVEGSEAHSEETKLKRLRFPLAPTWEGPWVRVSRRVQFASPDCRHKLTQETLICFHLRNLRPTFYGRESWLSFQTRSSR